MLKLMLLLVIISSLAFSLRKTAEGFPVALMMPVNCDRMTEEPEPR